MIRRNDIFLARTVGVGVLSAAQAAAFGASGPVARASGLDFDLRRDEPYLAYDQLTCPWSRRRPGDCHARFEVLLDQAYVSLDLATECLDRVDQISGPVNVRLPKVVKAPEGHTYAWTENPLGINGYYLVSRGEKTPWRLKLRTASYANVQALATLIPGCLVPDLIAILGLDVLRRRRHRQIAAPPELSAGRGRRRRSGRCRASSRPAGRTPPGCRRSCR